MKAKEAKIEEKTTAPIKPTDKEITTTERQAFNGPFTMMRRLAEDMENMFADHRFGLGMPRGSLLGRDLFADDLNDYWSTPFALERKELLNDFTPPVEMLEKNGDLIVRADLPGMEKENIKVEVTDNFLTIEGERKHESEEENEGVYRSERSFGSFYRKLPLPEGTITDEAKATFKNGVLEVKLTAPQIETNSTLLEITEESPDAEDGTEE